MKKFVYLLLIFTVLISCSKKDDSIDEPIKVTLSSTVTGTLNPATIEYKDETGTLKSETLPVGQWNKTFTVSNGFNLLVKAQGTINGSIELKATATGNGVSYNVNKNSSSNYDTNFELEISTKL